MESGVGRRRIRVRFEDRTLLTHSQISHGLRRCWLLFQPSRLLVISDLASHLLDKFSLHRSCPDGLLLYMHGYVLPPFESTSILMDNDIVRVKKKNGSAVNAIEPDETEDHSSDPVKVEGKQRVSLLAIERAVGTGEDQNSEHERVEELPSEITKSKKRRKSSLLLKRGKKRKKNSSIDDIKALTIADGTFEEIDSDVQVGSYDCNGNFPEKDATTKRPNRKVGPENDARCNQSLEHQQQNATSMEPSIVTKRVPSRSARRKKAKRLWLREQAKIQMENSKNDTKEVDQNCILEKKMRGASSDKLKTDNTNVETEVVPVVIRPGHIRFEPLDDSDSEKHKPVETIQWNGTISKKKGQKWGKEKTFVCEKNLDEDFDDLSDAQGYSGDNMSADADQQPCSVTLDFEKLCPVTSSPKVGDIVAYRLIELSSSWSPELSSFRVGKVTSYDLISNRVILVPLPEYPINLGDPNDADAVNSTSLYKEDGSLETDYAALVDIRFVLKEKTITESANKNDSVSGNNGGEPIAKISINGKVELDSDPWEELSKALDAKKVQLSQEQSAEKNWTSRSWSYRGLRGSALGPTITLLRAQNDL